MNTDRINLELKNYFYVARSQIFTIPFIVVFSLSIIIFLLYSTILGLTFILSYLTGAYISSLLSPRLPELLRPTHESCSTYQDSCFVCGDPGCGRQRPVGEHQPWVGLDVPRDIDQALQDLFNKLLNEFIGSWYGKLSKDESFLWEIRERLRFACSILLRRILRTDVGEVICERLLPVLLRHVDDFAVASDGCRTSADKVLTVVSHLGDRIHPAARSRHAELEYLKAVSRTLAQIGLYSQDIQCKAVSILLVELLAGWLLLTLSDTLCSPYVINTLLWLAVSSDKLQPITGQRNEKVQFLKVFATRPIASNNSILQSDLNTIWNNPHQLYPLMQYLKRCGAVHLLKFCLDIEDFNRRLLVPEISSSIATELFKEAWKLYGLYMKSDAPEVIPCSPGLGEKLHQVLSRGNDDISRLQKSTPLFQAYDEIFCLLEKVYLPSYLQSDIFYNHFCVRRDPINLVKVQQQKRSEPLVSKISQKLQRLVSGQIAEGSGLLVEAACDATDMDCSDELDLAGGLEFRDMADWKVQIPVAQIEQDSNSRPYPVFIIRVIAADIDEETWEVKRKLNDFYTLQAKLLEFHQKLVEALPPKKGLFSPRGTEFLESRRQSLEQYLKRLVQQPELRYSDLLHCFLRSPSEFQSALRSPISLYVMLRRSVEPMKLRKERGRHLDSFFNNLLTSIESHPKSELLCDISQIQRVKRDIRQGMFGDNLAPILSTSSPQLSIRPILRLSSFWDCLLYSIWRQIGCPQWLQRVVWAVKSSVGDVAAPAVHSYINRHLQDLLLPRLPHLIRLLQSAVLSPSKTHQESETIELREQVTRALTKPNSAIVAMLVSLLAPKWQEGVNTVIDTLQHPTLNKHLFYCLLDEVLRALFTEFSVPPKA